MVQRAACGPRGSGGNRWFGGVGQLPWRLPSGHGGWQGRTAGRQPRRDAGPAAHLGVSSCGLVAGEKRPRPDERVRSYELSVVFFRNCGRSNCPSARLRYDSVHTIGASTVNLTLSGIALCSRRGFECSACSVSRKTRSNSRQPLCSRAREFRNRNVAHQTLTEGEATHHDKLWTTSRPPMVQHSFGCQLEETATHDRYTEVFVVDSRRH